MALPASAKNCSIGMPRSSSASLQPELGSRNACFANSGAVLAVSNHASINESFFGSLSTSSRLGTLLPGGNGMFCKIALMSSVSSSVSSSRPSSRVLARPPGVESFPEPPNTKVSPSPEIESLPATSEEPPRPPTIESVPPETFPRPPVIESLLNAPLTVSLPNAPATVL